MLAPSYRRQQTKRQRGISLSRTSSQQKFYQSTNANLVQQLNQSFQCHQPAKSHAFYHEGNLNESALKEHNPNRPSLLGQKLKSSRQQKPRNTITQSHNRNRSLLQYSSAKQNFPIDQSLHVNDSLWQEGQSIHQMIDLLTEYEKSCQQQMDLESAEQARKRINQLKVQSINTRRKQLEVEGKQYGMKTRREGLVEKKEFYEFWDHKILEARRALKEIEEKHLQEQRKELAQYQNCVRSEPDPVPKYSSKVLQIRRNLTALIKSRKYKQAEHLKELLYKREAEEQEKWALTCHEKKLHKVKEFKKKQLVELEAFRLKLNSSFNELLKEKEKQEEKMSKRMKKIEVEAKKVPHSIVQARKELLNQSKATIDQCDQY